jgi:hypothetical protein
MWKETDDRWPRNSWPKKDVRLTFVVKRYSSDVVEKIITGNGYD